MGVINVSGKTVRRNLVVLSSYAKLALPVRYVYVTKFLISQALKRNGSTICRLKKS